MIAFSVKVRPAHGDLPAPSTTGALGIEAPALPIGSPDTSKYAVSAAAPVGEKQIDLVDVDMGVFSLSAVLDQTEAMTMADRIVVMNAGRILQVDTPQRLYDAPCCRFVAEFIGTPQMNFIPVEIGRAGGGLTADAGGRSFPIPAERSAGLEEYVGKRLILGIRPEDLCQQAASADGAAVFPGEVEAAEPMGTEVLCYFTAFQTQLIAKLPSKCPARTGDSLRLTFDMHKAHFFQPGEQGNCGALCLTGGKCDV